jgi:hypothetical protein
MTEPERPVLAYLTLPELRVLLRATLRVADPRDADFTQRLCLEIAAREKEGRP